MKKPAIALTALMLGLGLASGAWGQTRPSPEPAPGRTDAQRSAWSPDSGAVESSKLVGTRVQLADGKKIGEIDQLIVNHTDGKITHAVLGKGGVLGMGETKLVLRWSDIKLQRDSDHAGRWVAVVDQAKIDAAPRFEARKDRDTAPAASPGATPPATRTKEPAKRY